MVEGPLFYVEQLLPPTQPSSHKGFLTEGSIYTKKYTQQLRQIIPRENVSHYYLFSMGGSLIVTTKFLPAHPFTEDQLESQIPSNLNVEYNGQPPLLI